MINHPYMRITYSVTLMIMLFMSSISTQLLSQKHGFKRYQYDEFVYGLTVPKLKNIKAIADYYKITENEIYKLNQRFENDNLVYKKGQIIYLPAGTLLNNTNIAFEQLENFYKPLPTYQTVKPLDFPFKDTLVQPILITDTLVANYLLTDTTTFCIYSCSYAVAKVNLGGNYTGFIMEDLQAPNSETYLYIYFHNDFLRRIQIGGLLSGDGGHEFMSTTFKDYDSDEIAEILVKKSSESYYYDAVYFGDNSFRSYNLNMFQIDHQTYQLYKVVDGNYLNVSIDFILKD